MSGKIRPKNAGRDRALLDSIRNKQRAKTPAQQNMDTTERAKKAVREYYDDMRAAKKRYSDWYENGTGDQSESEFEAREWILRQTNSARPTFTQAEIDKAIRDARK